MIFQNKLKKILIIIFFILITTGCKKEDSQIPFDSEQWKQMDATERYRMYEDLKNNSRIIGMNQGEVEELLGQRALTYDSERLDTDNEYYWCYTIRYDSLEGEEELLVKFSDGKVVCLEKSYLSYL